MENYNINKNSNINKKEVVSKEIMDIVSKVLIFIETMDKNKTKKN